MKKIYSFKILAIVIILLGWGIKANAQSTYCESSSSPFPGDWELISNVTYGDVDNNSGQENYCDFTALSSVVKVGESFELSVTIDNFSNDVVCAWVDWNQDFVFDDDEKIMLSGSGLMSATINIPTNAIPGNTRMRISCRYAISPTPCESWMFGEVEDYTLTVASEGIFPIFNATPLEAGVNEEINFTQASLGEGITSYTWDFGDDATPSTFNGETPPAVVYSTLGLKTVSLTISDGTDTKTTTKENFINIVSGSANLAQPDYFSASADINVMTLNWYAPNEDPQLNSPESFESSFFPAPGWEIKVSDDLSSEPTNLPEGVSSWTITNFAKYLHSGNNGVVISYSKDKSNWLITPSVTVEDAQQLSFWMYFFGDDDYKSQFDIMVKEGESAWTNIKSFGADAPNNEMSEAVVIDLAEFAGKTVKFAFVQTYTDGYDVAIDDISIESNTAKREVSKTESYREPKSAFSSLKDNIIRDIYSIGRTKFPSVKYKTYTKHKSNEVPTGYKVYINGVQEGNILGADVRSFTKENLPAGKYKCSISTIFAEGESYQTEPIEINIVDPDISITSDKVIAGIDQDIQFTGAIVGSYNSIEWNFGDGAIPATSSDLNVTVKYSSLGKKTVSLTVNGNIVETRTDYITINPGIANVTPLKDVKAIANYEDVTISWPSLLSEVIFAEDFEGTWPPTGWEVKTSSTLDGSLTNPDEDADTWFHCDLNSYEDNHPEFIHSGDYSAGIGYTAPNFNWLVTPEINITEQGKLNFWIWYMQDEDYHTQFRVMVKADGVWKQELYYTEGTPINEYESIVTVDLAAYAGKSVQVAFVYEYSDSYQLNIDDVQIVGQGTRSLADDFSKLNIYKNDALVKEITTPSVAEWTDNDLANGTYKYYVTFVNAAGQESYPCQDMHVKAINKVDAPYEQDFEVDYSDWFFNNSPNAFKVGQDSDFNNAKYNFPTHEGNYVAVNTSDISGGIFGYPGATDLIEFSPINLDSYGRAYFTLDYMSHMASFVIVGRPNTNAQWKVVKQLDYSEDWKSNQKITLPSECLAEGYQFGLHYSNLSKVSKGVAFDNVRISGLEGKHIAVDYKNSEYTNNGNVYLGKIKENTSKDYNITITNVGNEVIDISDITLSGDNFTLKSNPSAKSTMQVGASADIVITYTQTEATTTPDTGIITITSNDQENSTFVLNIFAECGVSEWTYMVYLYEDGTGLDGNKDINEWEVLGSIPGKVNYIVLYDCDDDTKDGIYYVTKDEEGMNTNIVSERISTHMNDGLDMDNAETLKDFIIWGKNNYPAKHYGCNVWDHGSGIFKRETPQWKSACGNMKVWELASALNEFKNVDGQGFDIFGFDVCLLGQVETVYDIKDYTKVVIASERTEPGDGWDYNTHFKMLNDNNGEVDIYEFASNIVDEFDASYDGGSQGYKNTTQSAIRTDKFASEFIPALNAFSDAITPELYLIKDMVKMARNEAWYSDDLIEHRDLGNFLDILKTKDISEELKTKIDELRNSYDACIVNSKENGHSGVATGLKIWMPEKIVISPMAKFYLMPNQYLKISETKWDEFLAMYGNPIEFGIPAPSIKAITSTNISTGNSVTLQDITSSNPVATERTWTITPNTYQFISGDEKAETIEILFNQEGVYSVKLEVTNAEGTGSVTKEDMITVKDEFDKPTNLKADLDNESRVVTLTWNKPENTVNFGETDKLIEGFEDSWLPTGWDHKSSTSLTAEHTDPTDENIQNGNAWFRCDENTFTDFKPGYIHSGNYSAAILFGAPDYTWLITPEVTVTSADKLKFWIWYNNGESNGVYYHTNFHVMIKADNSWNEVLSYTDGTPSNNSESEVVIDLADYADKAIQIAFVYEYTDGWQLMIDDVYVGTGDNPAASTRKVASIANTRELNAVPYVSKGNNRELVSYNIYRNDQKIDNVSTLQFQDQLSDEAGEYEYYVTAVYETPEGKSSASNKVTVKVDQKPLFNAPANLNANLDANTRTVAVVWEKPEGSRAVVSYNVFRNDEQIANVSELTYADQLSDEAGEYEYFVTAVYETPEGESVASNKVVIKVEKKTTTAIGDGMVLNVSAYPNPNKGTFTVNVSNANNVQWYLLDINGRVVNSGLSNNNNIVISTDRAGVYMVKVVADQKTSIIKVVVK